MTRFANPCSSDYGLTKARKWFDNYFPLYNWTLTKPSKFIRPETAK